jgi:hypothetical protein
MRRILLGGLGIALGVLCRPALAQQPVADRQPPPSRAATLGRPSAIPESPPTARASSPEADPEVTPAGLLNRTGPARPRLSFGFGTPTPLVTQPPGTVGAPAQPGNGQPMQPMIPPPRPVTGQPMVTETRDPMKALPVVVPGVPGVAPGVIVPSVGPEGYVCPVPEMEDPIYGPMPGGRAFRRLRNCGNNAWVSAEVLLWWTKSTQVPALVTTSSPQFNGIPGTGDTQVLLGGTFDETYHVGGRIGFGWWFGNSDCRGVDARLFWMGPTSTEFTATTPPYAILARPFFNVNPATGPAVGFGPTAEVVGGPGVATGGIAAVMDTSVWGAEVNYRRFLCGDACARVDLLLGYRYFGLTDTLTITEVFNRVPGSPDVGVPAQSGVVTDRFRTENHFHGGQIGLAGEWRRGRWYLDTRASVALGSVAQTAEITGSQTLAFPNGTTAVVPGGLLAVPGANIGRWDQHKFAVVPEVGVNIGYQVTSHLRMFVGYNFLYLSTAVRPGGAINPRIDAARVPNFLPPGTAPLPGLPHPQPQLSTTGFFIQGISFGLSYRW